MSANEQKLMDFVGKAVGDPAAPRLRKVVPLDLAAVSVDAAGTTAAVVGSVPAPTLVLLDLSDRSSPRIEARVPLPAASQPTGVALADGFALVAGQGGGLAVIPIP